MFLVEWLRSEIAVFVFFFAWFAVFCGLGIVHFHIFSIIFSQTTYLWTFLKRWSSPMQAWAYPGSFNAWASGKPSEMPGSKKFQKFVRRFFFCRRLIHGVFLRYHYLFSIFWFLFFTKLATFMLRFTCEVIISREKGSWKAEGFGLRTKTAETWEFSMHECVSKWSITHFN